MADEPYMRLQRGQQLLGGAAPFMPTYQTGYGIGSNALQGVQQTCCGAGYLTCSKFVYDV